MNKASVKLLFSTLGIKHSVKKAMGCIATDMVVLLLTKTVILVTEVSLLLTGLFHIVVVC